MGTDFLLLQRGDITGKLGFLLLSIIRAIEDLQII